VGQQQAKKRVCLVRHWYYPHDNHLKRDAEALLASGWEVDVVCLRKKGEKAREVVKGVQVYRLPVEHHRGSAWRYLWEYSAFLLLAFVQLTLLFLRKRYQVIEVSNMPDILVFSTLVPRLLGTRVVLYMREQMPETFASVFGAKKRHPFVQFLSLLQRLSMAYADHIIVPGTLGKEYFQASGVPGDKISVIENAPDEDIFHPLTLPQENGHFRLVTHGSLLERYGVQTLLRAVPLLVGEIPNLEVWVVGDGEYRPALEDLSRGLQVEDRVRFTGWLPFTDLPKVISEAQVGVVAVDYAADWLPNKWLPNKILEYLAMGKPVVVSGLEAYKAYVPEEAALYFRPGDERELARCVLELYRDPKRRAAMAARGQAIYEQIRWSVTKEKYLTIFEGLR
jgi:glycosyltransferase involved in cell wall biosynthesis